MSLHLNIEEYICKNCKTAFLPYYKGLECPNCEENEDSEGHMPAYDFIHNQVAVMMGHKRKYNQFSPLGWYSGSYSDQIQWIVFRVFDKKYNSSEECDFTKEASSVNLYDGENNIFKNDAYLNTLFNLIDKALNIKLEEYTEGEKIKVKMKEDAKLKNRIKRFFKNIKIKSPPKRTCLCTEPLCGKCLSVNCEDEDCLIHTKEAKKSWKERNKRN